MRNFLYPRLPVSFVISPIYESGKLVLISMGFLGYNNSFEKFFPNSDSGKAAPTYIILGSLMRSKFPILGCPLLDGRQQAPV